MGIFDRIFKRQEKIQIKKEEQKQKTPEEEEEEARLQ